MGAKVIVAGSAHHADRAHLRPLPAGASPGATRRSSPACCSLMIEHDWIDHEFIERAHRRLRAGRRVLQAVDARAHRRGHRRPRALDPQGGRVVGHGEDELPVPRARHRAPLQRRAERARHDQPRARVGPASASRRAATARSSARRNGQGGREHGQKCDQLPGWRDIANPEHREYIAGVWGVDETELPGPGVDAYEMFRKIDAGEIKGLLSICFNPKVSLPDNQFVTRALEKLEFFVAIDFFLNETARHADVVLPGSLQEEDEGTVTQVEGRVIKINKAVELPRRGARRTGAIIQDIARALGRPHGFTFDEPARDLRGAARREQGRRRRLLGHHLREDRARRWACSGRATAHDPETGEPTPDHPGTPRLFEPGSYNPVAKGAGPFYFPDGKARFNVADYRPPVDDASRGVSALPDHRPRRQPVPLRHADAPHRPARRAVPRAAHRDAPAARREARHRRRRLGDRARPAAARSRSGRWS